ncbi:MAG: signal peptidase I [Bdellovibrionaceae bacterium]|nr:signal peptidase I [Pseudobdellovibrionaceae bacterium]|tara:strand:- start:20284 stop:21009 length:726 start_codon:yes stop_codon:yes gene_type:complete
MTESKKATGEEFSTSLKKVGREYAEALILAILIALFFRTFVVSVYRVKSVDMAPTLFVGDVVVGYKFPFSKFGSDPLGELQRGDLVLFSCPGRKSARCLSRVVGLPGDEVLMHRGRLSINGVELNYSIPDEITEEWLSQPNFSQFDLLVEKDLEAIDSDRRIFVRTGSLLEPQQQTVPPGEVFLLSDYRNSDQSSFHWGVVKHQAISARAVGVLFSLRWPLDPEETPLFPGLRWDRWFLRL